NASPRLYLGKEVDRLRVARPGEVVDPGVEALGQRAGRARRAVEEDETEAIRLFARALLRAPRDPFAVRREPRGPVERGVRRGQVSRLTSGERLQPDVGVGREGLDRVGVGGVNELPAVGRDVEVERA